MNNNSEKGYVVFKKLYDVADASKLPESHKSEPENETDVLIDAVKTDDSQDYSV